MSVVPMVGNPGLIEHCSIEAEHMRGGKRLRSILIRLSYFTAVDPDIQRGEDTSQGHTASTWQSWSGTRYLPSSETDLPKFPLKLCKD